MIRHSLTCLILFLPVSAFADRPPKADPFIKVEGTTWEGEDTLDTKWKCTFLKDGVLQYTTNGNTYTRASWKQDGKKLYWETNGRYAEYNGTVTREEIKMEVKNITGLTWKVNLKLSKEEVAKP